MLQNIDDELIQYDFGDEYFQRNILVLSYPHWRVGTIPLTPKIKSVFPTALQTERVKISFHDPDDNETISAWLIRPDNYVWFKEIDMMIMILSQEV